MRRAMFVLAAWAGIGLSACTTEPQPPIEPPPEDCVLDAPAEKTPGYPFDSQMFRDQVWPVLAGSCMGSGCHTGPSGIGNFSVWAVSDDPCDFVSTFEQVAAQTDLVNRAENSRVYAAVAGAKPAHFSLTSKPEDLQILLDYVTDAFERKQKDDPTKPGISFDFARYQTDIDPLFQKNGCLNSGCHDPASNGGGFSLAVGPATDSDEMQANFDQVLSRVEVTKGKDGAELSEIYVRTQNVHYSARFAPEDAAKLLDWIRDGIPDGELPTCTDAGRFNLGVFEQEIMPILDGRVDLEDRDGAVGAGCARSACHGQQRGPGTLYLVEGAPAAQNLESFACFVNLSNPSASHVLACPLGLSSCPVPAGHPGGDIFAGVQDLNYQRILSYLYAATANSPLDFAFYVRKIDPLFNDERTIQDGVTNQTCADTLACHGITREGAVPPNFSNFGIFPNTTDPRELLLNYASSSNFTHFQQADQSALILYPTNEIFNLDNPLATGTQHPVVAFDLDDVEAETILEWAGGLRTTGDGFVRHWLMAGDFLATDVDAEAIFGEESLRPEIFDKAGGALEFNGGAWDGFFSAEKFIDLNDPDQGFPREGGANRIVYAVAYLINTSNDPIDAQITVTSPNDVEVFVGDINNLGLGGQSSVRIELPGYAPDVPLTRVMVKVFQAEGDVDFGFELQVTDESGNFLGDQILIKLGPEGSV